MGRPRGRKRAIRRSSPPAAAPEDPQPAAAADRTAEECGPFAEQQRAFSDREVQRRIVAIQAIRDAETENLLSRLRLLRSFFSKEQRETCAMQFFRENLPNLSVVKKENDGVFELEWKDKLGSSLLNHVNGVNGLASVDRASTLPASVCGLEFSARSFKMNFLEAASYQIPGYGFDEPFDSQFVGSKDAFRTPGATSQRLSVGVTPGTLRLPKHGEMLLSVHGSPLGVYRQENLEAIHESGDSPHGASG